MPRANDVVEQLLQEYADLLSISGGDPFKPRAYEKAARSVRTGLKVFDSCMNPATAMRMAGLTAGD